MAQLKELRLDCRKSFKQMKTERKSSWLADHLETFVRPYLGRVPRKSIKNYFSPSEMSVIKSIWRSVKKRSKGRTIILPGRDVFIFEILARREGYPTVFIPSCSRLTIDKFAFNQYNPREHYILDTGFFGSIPKGLGFTDKDYCLVSYNKKGDLIQVFPHLTHSRHLALQIEKTPKYWKRGYLDDLDKSKIKQELSNKEEFLAAAQLTIEIYTDSSPKSVNKSRPLYKKPTLGTALPW